MYMRISKSMLIFVDLLLLRTCHAGSFAFFDSLSDLSYTCKCFEFGSHWQDEVSTSKGAQLFRAAAAKRHVAMMIVLVCRTTHLFRHWKLKADRC